MSFHHRLTLWMAMAIAMTCSSVANAAAPQVKSQAPGYYRMMLGDFEITALSDGTFGFPAGKMMGNISPQKLASELSQNFLNDPVEESVNGFLINTGTKLILIDTGDDVDK